MEIKSILENIRCSAAAPTPKVLANEHYVYLIFFVEDSSVQDAENSPFNRVPVDQVCSIRFNKYAKYRFGNPNDETLDGYHYYDLGLEPFCFQEIIDSDWIEDLREMNSMDPVHDDTIWDEYQHIIIPLKDSCFEVVCKSYTVMNEPCQTIREEVLRLAELV